MMSTKALMGRVERLESQLRPAAEDTALQEVLAAIYADIARAGERMKAEHPEWFEPGGPAVMPQSVGWGASKRFIRELTAEEAAAHAAWCARHGVDEAGVRVAEKVDLERQERLVKLRATPDFLRGLADS